jgi:hypothetical protein
MSSAPTTKTESPPPEAAKPRRKRFHIRLTLAGLLLLALILLIIPATFRCGIRISLLLLARQKGIDLTIGKISGSIFQPVSFYDVKWSSFSPGRTTVDLRMARADVDISIQSLVFKRGAGCLRSASVDGLAGGIKFHAGDSPAQKPASAEASAESPWVANLMPLKIVVTHVNLTFQQEHDFVRLENLSCTASNTEPGVVNLDNLVIHQPWLTRNFSPVSGTTTMEKAQFSVANVSLEKGISVTSASSDIAEIANRRLKIEFDIAAFEGAIRGEIKSAAGDLHSQVEVNGSFAQISVPPLAAFFGFTGESGGIVKEGRFTFLGSPRDMEKATLSVRLEATDFRLGKRQWNSLVGGATMAEHRIQIPEMTLKQAHNELSLKGYMALPQPGIEWWQSEFAFDTSAKIDNLTELSALFGPDFADMAGKVTIDGSIKGTNRAFSGELAISGSELSYRSAPLDTLHASVILNGNELQVANLELSSKNDFVRGKGVVNILGQEKRYWGDLKASVADLSRYSAILQKPIIPQPLAGGLTVDWSGDGVATAHSGAFHAQLKKFRLISITEPKAHPLNADLEATYSPGNIFFSKFLIWDNVTNFSAKVTAAPRTLNLQSLRLQQNNEVWLEGDALLPFNVWSAWQNASWTTLLEFESPCKINLTARNLDLHDTALLSGRQIPVKGQLDMNLTAGGTLNDIQTGGHIQLKKAQITAGDSGQNVIGAEAGLAFDGQNLEIEKSQIRFNNREFGMQGKIHFKNLRDPDFDLDLLMKKIPFQVSDNAMIDADLDLNARGAFNDALVSGTAQVLDLKLSEKIQATALAAGRFNLDLSPTLPFDASQSPFNTWQINVALCTPQPATILWEQNDTTPDGDPNYEAAGSLTATFVARGKGASLKFAGEAAFQDVPVNSVQTREDFNHDAKPLMEVVINNATLFYSADDSPVWFAAGMSAKAGHKNITGWTFGRENEISSIFLCDPPLRQEEILALITKGAARPPDAIANVDTRDDVPLELSEFSAPLESPIDLSAK